MAKSVFHVDGFSPQAKLLRAEFEQRFRNPKQVRGDRFVWDYWHIPGQYTQLRTPAPHFFSKKTYEAFHNQLVWWGRRNLGCHDITPTWLSCYVEGCEQRLHGDLPHGPWAFVFSLTPWAKRKFRGGETLLLREEMLDYWSSIDRFPGLEEEQIFERVAPKFNRLVVFDPRIPHGVEKVSGVQDIVEGRLVLHGWFVNPRPFIEGPISRNELSDKIMDWTRGFDQLFSEVGEVRGLLSVQIRVSSAGKIQAVKILSNCLRSVSHRPEDILRIQKFVRASILKSGFHRAKSASLITVPFVFAGGAS